MRKLVVFALTGSDRRLKFMAELEIINKLFLELSQVATAETEKELFYKAALQRIQFYPVHSEPFGGAMAMKDIAGETLKRAQFI